LIEKTATAASAWQIIAYLNFKFRRLLWKNNPKHTGLLPEITKTLICYTIFTSRRLWGLVVSEIYIESFEDGVRLSTKWGVGFILDKFLVY